MKYCAEVSLRSLFHLHEFLDLSPGKIRRHVQEALAFLSRSFIQFLHLLDILVGDPSMQIRFDHFPFDLPVLGGQHRVPALKGSRFSGVDARLEEQLCQPGTETGICSLFAKRCSLPFAKRAQAFRLIDAI